jgi:hypothetical protein
LWLLVAPPVVTGGLDCRKDGGSLQGATRRAACALSAAASARVSGVTQTVSPLKASRQTKPCRQVNLPKAPPLGLTRDNAAALSALASVRVCGVTHTWSMDDASRQTKP